MHNRLQQQIQFLCEIDKLKSIYRKNVLSDLSREETSAEHSWHLALLACFLFEYAEQKLDVLKLIKLVLVHDIVEVDAGDTFCHDLEGQKDKAQREQSAAERIFSLLPLDQQDEMWGLWKEFEEKKTPEAQFAQVLDRLQPCLLHWVTEGFAWKKHGVSKDQLMIRIQLVQKEAPKLWPVFEELIRSAEANKWFSE